MLRGCCSTAWISTPTARRLRQAGLLQNRMFKCCATPASSLPAPGCEHIPTLCPLFQSVGLHIAVRVCWLIGRPATPTPLCPPVHAGVPQLSSCAPPLVPEAQVPAGTPAAPPLRSLLHDQLPVADSPPCWPAAQQASCEARSSEAGVAECWDCPCRSCLRTLSAAVRGACRASAAWRSRLSSCRSSSRPPALVRRAEWWGFQPSVVPQVQRRCWASRVCWAACRLCSLAPDCLQGGADPTPFPRPAPRPASRRRDAPGVSGEGGEPEDEAEGAGAHAAQDGQAGH